LRKTIVCLANSYKHGGRCIAGVDIHDGQWIRLHGNSPDGALCACEYATDPHWLDQLKLLPDGIYPHSTFAGTATETWLTISLSEPYFNFHYKLVAGVIVRTESQLPTRQSKSSLCEPRRVNSRTSSPTLR
jgi:hypothetical protein